MSQPGGSGTGQGTPPSAEGHVQSWSSTPQPQQPPPVQQGGTPAGPRQQPYHQQQTPQHFHQQPQAAQQPMHQQPRPQQVYPQQQPQQQQQYPQQPQTTGGPPASGTPHQVEEGGDTVAAETLLPATPGLKSTLQNLSMRFTSPSAHTEEPNVGFTPTPAMVKKHEKTRQEDEPARPLYQFQVTKLRTWRTGYVRLLRLYRDNFCTIDPDTHEVTNTWSYDSLMDWLAIPKEDDCILLQVGSDKLKLQCHHVDRSTVLTALLECKWDNCEAQDYPLFQTCSRQTRHGTRVSMSLKVAPHGLIEIHPMTKRTLQTYRYVNVKAVSFTSDDATGIVLHTHNKSRVFFVESSRRHGSGRSDLLTGMKEHCDSLGLVELRIAESCKLTLWMERRRVLGKAAGGPVVTTWDVTKTTRRHDAAIVGHEQGWMRGTVSRRLTITGKGILLESDGAGVVNCRRLSDIHGLVRHPHADTLTIEYKDGSSRTYASANRDALLVSLLDAANFLGNNASVHVSNVTSGGYCLSSLDGAAPEAPPSSSGIIFHTISIPVHCLKRLHSVSTAAYAYLSRGTESSSTREGEKLKASEECAIVVEACREFNASVAPTGEGLPKAPTDRSILGSIGALWGILTHLLHRPTDQTNIREWHEAELAATPMFQALYRLTQTPAGYKGTAELDTMQECVELLWDLDDAFCQFWMLRVLNALLSGPAKRDKEVEFVNKSVILKTGGTTMVDGLVSTMLDAGSTQPAGQRAVSDLILFVTSDILQSFLCSNHDTTSPEHFAAFIKSLANGHRALLSALQSPTPFVIENTALLLHLLSTHDPETAHAIREAALGSGILLQHFHAAIFSPLEGQRFLSRYLCSLWLSGPMDCDEKRLLKRMVPSGFIGYLNMPTLSRMEEEQLDELERDAAKESAHRQGQSDTEALGASGTNTARLRSRMVFALETSPSEKAKPENFRIFFHVLTKDHALADLIWNQQTRQELRMALENEIQSIKRVAESRGGIDRIAWNHQQFTVEYPSLDNEVKVGTVYMRLWLQAGDGFIRSWEEPYRLFELLFRRFLCELDRNTMVTIMCIRCLERLYAIHADVIGPFSDIMILVRSMASTKNIETQHRLLGLVATLLGVSGDEERHGKISIPENAEQLLNVESIGQLCQFVAWGHTNGEQVGNLLSTMLGAAKKQREMIMDETGTGPRGAPTGDTNGMSSESDLASDRWCPPVWFVSSSGRTPPPPETIRGPFRVSELMTMMQNGDLSPYDQVTTSSVDVYNEDEREPESDEPGDSSVKDSHIDTGKWRRVNEVWQLRWQLCADGSSNGIFQPSEVSLMALRALTRLVDLHKSLDSRGVPYFPVPIAKRLLCGLSREMPRGTKPENGIDIDQSDSFLPILSQSLLCNDHHVVAAGAELLHKLMQNNQDAVSKFYLSGAFFFALNYTGNNFRPLAELLYANHLNQHFRSGFAAAANDTELPLRDRSILGNMLPEGLLFVLVNYGVDRFTEIFVGNYDTPEVIWNLEMRQHLVEMIRQHLGDFPRRLHQNTSARYEYCPIPGIAYQRLEKELFCHNYYLNNLCDEVRFPDWPIAEPVEVFRACLEEWKLQLRRDAAKEEDAQEEARKVLSLKSGAGSKELRKAYRGLARKYHPDKNPAGREMFEAIQEAYELLLPVVEGGRKIVAKVTIDVEASEDKDTLGVHVSACDGLGGGVAQMQTMHLLIRTQLLICRRYANDMSKYKYPAYRSLLGCLEVPASCRNLDVGSDPVSILESCLLLSERAEFVRTAVDLVFHTCLVSPLNAEELIAEGGIPVLESLLDFYATAAYVLCDSSTMDALPKEKVESLASKSLIVDILSNLVHTLSGVAFFENGRQGILSLKEPKRFSLNWRRCLECKFKGVVCNAEGTSLVKRFALEGVANMAKDRELQNILVGSGILWPLIKNMLAYDPTLEATYSEGNENADLSQATNNELGRLSARALGMLSGVMLDTSLKTPANPELQRSLGKLLSEPIARMLRNKRSSEILQTMNTNVETPVRIWNVDMRKELSSFVAQMEKERPENTCRPVTDELESVLTTFKYTVLENETTVGGVYLRVFNALGGGREALREISDTSQFGRQILSFIALCMNQSTELGDSWVKLPPECIASAENVDEVSTSSISDSRFIMATIALSHLVRVDGLIEDVLCDSTNTPTAVLLGLLELPQESKEFDIGCEILSLLSPKQPFADAVAEQDSLWRLLWVLERPDKEETESSSGSHSRIERLQRGWALLESFSSTSSIAMNLLHSSGWLEILGIMAGYEMFTKRFVSRLGAAKTLARLLWDTKTGPLAVPLLQRFLPQSLIVVLKEEGPESMLKLFDRESETPELIWNGAMRGELRSALAEQLGSIVKERTEEDSKTEFRLSPDAGAKYKNLEDELYIGGVYVRLFLKEPTFGLRDPTSFLEKLLIRWTHELEVYTSNKNEGNTQGAGASNGAVTEARQDALQLVTSAIVYLCKVRDSLCDKLAQWGYMARAMTMLQDVLSCGLVGAPLLSIMRILHVASNRMVNVEALAVAGGSDGKRGIVDYTIQAIGTDPLHKDSAFMVEVLLKVFRKALGDVKNASKVATKPLSTPSEMSTVAPHEVGSTSSNAALAMAPSPAPGLEPVRKTTDKGKIDHPLDHPLAFPGPDAPSRSHGTAAQTRTRTGGHRQQPQPSGGTGRPGYLGTGHASPYQGHPIPGNSAAQHPLARQGPAADPTTNHPLSNSGGPGLVASNVGFSSQRPDYVPHQASDVRSYSNLSSPLNTNRAPGSQGTGFAYGDSSAYNSPSRAQAGSATTTPGRVSSQTTTGKNLPSYSSQVTPAPVAQSHVPTSYVASPGVLSGGYAASSHPMQTQPSPASSVPSGGPQYSQQSVLQQATAPSATPGLQQAQSGHIPPHSAPMQSAYGASVPVQQPAPVPSAVPHYQNSQQVPLQQATSQPASFSLQQTQVGQVTSHPAPTSQAPLSVGSHQNGDTQQAAMQPVNQMMPPNQQQPQFGQASYQSTPSQPTPPLPLVDQPFPLNQQQQPKSTQAPSQPAPMGAQASLQQPQVAAPSQGVLSDSTQADAAQGAHPNEVSTPAPARPYRPTPIEGSGIDARSAISPKQKAEQQMLSSAGAPGSAQGRVSLLQSALVCELPKFLVEGVLENPSLSTVKDPAATKVHAVELLKLLTMDPGYGLKFKLVLEDMPAWKKYKSQDHSLFITGSEQKADYFLTEGDKEPTKLLTER